MKIQRSAYEIIDKDYPGLIQFGDGLMYFSDQSISKSSLSYYTSEPDINYIISGSGFTLYGEYLTLVLFNYKASGTLLMDYDLKLSNETCMGLYEYNIHICYNANDTKWDEHHKYIAYDRQAIEREYVIKDIINGTK